VEIDARDVRAKAAQAHAAARGIDEAIASAAASIEAAQANANFADATYKRFAALRERGSVSPHEFEEVAAKQKGALAELERARRGHDQLLAQRAQALAAVAEAESFMSDSAVRSPIDGVISARFVDPGAQAAPGMPLLTVEGGGQLRIDTTVDETLAPLVHTGQNVDVDGIAARVAHVAPVDPATRSAVVKIEMPATSNLRPGTFVHVSFPIGTRNTLVVPKAAVVRSGSLANVFVVDEQGAARMRLVTIGAGSGNGIEVLSGIDAGERIVSAASAVRDGVRVRSAS
jgi:RND family efflux transporter MFP subunit